jgi:Tfp pilus assembly protein PilV
LTVAIAVLLVAVLSTGVAQLSALRLQEGAKETTLANGALESAMEAILSRSLDDLDDVYPADQPMTGFAAPGITDLRIVPSYPGWAANAPAPDPLTIVVVATWTDRRGLERRDTLRGMKTR